MFFLTIWLLYDLFAFPAENIALETENNNKLKKWKKAVIHLECATDKIAIEKYLRLKDELMLKFAKNEISSDEFNQKVKELELAWDKGKHAIRSFGTAIFMEHNQRRYLITARHVLYDSFAGSKKPEAIFNIIFREPSLDEGLVKESKIPKPFLMNLGVGPPKSRAYTFTHPSIDLAIISLDRKPSNFFMSADILLSLGHVPITISDIVNAPSTEGAEVFTVGYPSSTSRLGELRIRHNKLFWNPLFFSLPTFSFGRVAMLNDKLSNFLCDITVYPGNSGGPVIENGNLVGIVIEQPWVATQIYNTEKGIIAPLIGRSRLPFSRVTKAEFIKELLQIQIKKDSLVELHN
jgi:hypothetical protein